MIISITNQHVKKMDYFQEGRVCSRLYLYSLDGAFENKLRQHYEKQGLCKEAQQLIADDETELSYIHINYQSHEITAFRSITSHYELFYSELPDGGKVITDHMRNMLAYLPFKDRAVSVEAVCDVALFQHNYGKETYLKNVYRLCLGESLIFRHGTIQVQQTQLFELQKYDLRGERGEKVIEDSLRSTCSKIMEKDAVNTLSGGVDSVLTQIIMGTSKSISGCYQQEHFQQEKEYALDAASLLHTDHTIYEITMSEYMDKLRSVAMAYGMPPFNLTTQAMHLTISEHIKNTQIFVSEMAGGAFGAESRTPCTAEAAEQYPMNHLCNWANANNNVVGEEEKTYLRKLFGKDMVDSRLQNRNDFVLAHLKNFDTSDRSIDNYIQLGAYMRYFSYNVVAIEEQTETEAGNRIACLTGARRLMEQIASLDVKGRYLNAEYGDKPYAKILLKQLLPEYDVKKPKLGGALPRTWMVTEGPMSGYFQKHDIPGFVPESLWEEMKNPAWDCSWGVKHMVMYSIWKENVLDQMLDPLPSKYSEDTRF